MSNICPNWEAYRALILGRLIGLDKVPGIDPVVVYDTWQRILAKCVLAVTGEEAKEACGTEQICGGFEAGNEGGVQAVRLLWKQHVQ